MDVLRVEFRKCPACKMEIPVVLEVGYTRCGLCWEGLIEVGGEDEDE